MVKKKSKEVKKGLKGANPEKVFMQKVEASGLSLKIDWKALFQQFGPVVAELALQLIKALLEQQPVFKSSHDHEEEHVCCALSAAEAIKSCLTGDHEDCMCCLLEALQHCAMCCHEHTEESDESE